MEYDLRNLFARESQKARQQIEKVLTVIDKELRNAANELTKTLNFGYEINTGTLGKLNHKFVVVADYLLLALMSPFALLSDILLRYFVGKLPLIKNLMPAVFIRNKVVKTIEKSLQDICNKVVLDFTDQFKQSFARIADNVSLHFKHLYQVSVMPIIRAIEAAENAIPSPQEIDAVRMKLNMICSLAESLKKDC